MLTSVLLLHAFCVQAADVNVSLKEALDSVGDYCYESVTDPGYGSEWFYTALLWQTMMFQIPTGIPIMTRCAQS